MAEPAPERGIGDDASGRPPASASELFVTFMGISMQSFGGALAIIERTVVRDKRWLTASEFVGVYAVSQVLPGPTGISFCVLLGDRFHGFRGAVAALGGFVLLPAVVVIAIASLFQQFEHVPQIQGAVHAMGCATAGLILSTVIRLSRTLRGRRVGIVVALASFVAVGIARVPVSNVVLTLGVASVAYAWHRRGR